ncbi:hypothetical protein ACFE04_002334 [Oxalis oulophora]
METKLDEMVEDNNITLSGESYMESEDIGKDIEAIFTESSSKTSKDDHVVKDTVVSDSDDLHTKEEKNAPSPVAFDEERLNQLIQMVADSVRKGSGCFETNEFSTSSIDVLIAEVCKLQQDQMENTNRFEKLSRELVRRLVAVQAVLKNEMKISAQLQKDVISYKMTADRLTMLFPEKSDENELLAQHRRLLAEVEVLKARLKKMDSEALAREMLKKG